MARCTATTAKGTRCKNNALTEREVCKQHSGDPNVGRHHLLDGDMIVQAEAALRAGNRLEATAIHCGVHPATFYRWREHGEADQEAGKESKEREFYEATTRASADAEVHAVANWRAQMPTDWRACAEWLARKDPENWGRINRHVHDATVEHTGKIEIAKIDERIDQLLADLGASGEAAAADPPPG